MTRHCYTSKAVSIRTTVRVIIRVRPYGRSCSKFHTHSLLFLWGHLITSATASRRGVRCLRMTLKRQSSDAASPGPAVRSGAPLPRPPGRPTRGPRPHLHLEREHIDEAVQQAHVVEPARSAGGAAGVAEHAGLPCSVGATRDLLLRLLGEAAPHLLGLRVEVGVRAITS